MQMTNRPAHNKALYLPLAWIRLVLERDDISTHLLTNDSLDLWKENQVCIHEHFSKIMNPLTEIVHYESKILNESNESIEITIQNKHSNINFLLRYIGNDWYIDLDILKREICNDSKESVSHV